MGLPEQIQQFRSLLAEQGAGIESFELNVAGDGFRALMSGGSGQFEVRCLSSGVQRCYPSDGGPDWLLAFSADLKDGLFAVLSDS